MKIGIMKVIMSKSRSTSRTGATGKGVTRDSRGGRCGRGFPHKRILCLGLLRSHGGLQRTTRIALHSHSPLGLRHTRRQE